MREKYNENNAGGFFKYYALEQYEDVLQQTRAIWRMISSPQRQMKILASTFSCAIRKCWKC